MVPKCLGLILLRNMEFPFFACLFGAVFARTWLNDSWTSVPVIPDSAGLSEPTMSQCGCCMSEGVPCSVRRVLPLQSSLPSVHGAGRYASVCIVYTCQGSKHNAYDGGWPGCERPGAVSCTAVVRGVCCPSASRSPDT